MKWLVAKYLVTALVVVAVSEVARRSARLGGLVGAIPLVTVLALIWMQFEGQPQQRIASYAGYTFWYVLPTLPMFLVFPVLLPRLGFWLTLLSCIALAIVCFGLLALLVRPFGIDLMP